MDKNHLIFFVYYGPLFLYNEDEIKKRKDDKNNEFI